MDYYFTGACFFTWILVSVWGLANVYTFFGLFFFETIEARVTSTGSYQETWDGETTTFYTFRYRFEIDGREYTGSSSDSFIGSYGGMEKGEHKAGDRVTILYNPRNPTENYSSRAGFYGGLFLTAFAQLFLLLAIHTLKTWY